MHRLLIDRASLECDSPVLPRDAARHLKVLRPKAGERVELFDGHGAWRVYRCAGGALVADTPLAVESPRAGSLTLFACVTKGSRWDWTLEKSTELGVTRIVPVISDRTIVRLMKQERAAKRERWLRIVEDAARQSDARWLPEVMEAVDFADSLSLVKETRCLIGALTNPPSPMIGGAAKDADAVFIGPEGDFTPEELAALMKVAKPVSFGPTILRAETAAIFAISALVACRG